MKTKAFINGTGGWSKVDATERKVFLSEVCDLACECATIFAIGLSFQGIENAYGAGHNHPFGKSYWIGAAMFLAALVQKKMQKVKKNKGLTVFICDDNKKEMANFSDALYRGDAWYDPLYQTSKTRRGGTVWLEIPPKARFNQIVNSAFAIKSHHSSLVQVADAVSYVCRRDLELVTANEEWEGERDYYRELGRKIEEKREHLGRRPGEACIDFYKAARHSRWTL